MSHPESAASPPAAHTPADRTVFEVAFDSAPNGIVVCDEAGIILFVNQQIASTFGYEREGLLGQPIELLVPQAVAHLHSAQREGFSRHPETPPMGAGEVRGRRLDGSEVPVEVGLAVASQGAQRLVVASVVDITERRKFEEQLRSAFAEVQRLKDRLARENVQRRDVKALRTPRTVAAESAAARLIMSQIEQVAPTTASVLLLGETGSGKEVFAQVIHDLSPRHHRPMVRVNCAAIPSALLESELFGRERGAYTGALSRQIGRFEAADGSTIFLDEIGDLPLDAQTKLLRVLQDRVIERLGSNQPVKVDVRVIAATHRDLEKLVAAQTFREDLYYRLNVFPLAVPPLRERVEDIPILVWNFIDEFSKSFGKSIESIAKDSMLALQRYSWPGNVRELRNVIERAAIVADGPHLTVDLPKAASGSAPKSLALTDMEGEHIRAVLERTSWRVRGLGGAAALLGMKPTTLESRMAKLGIRRAAR